jgi:hypothetical protein
MRKELQNFIWMEHKHNLYFSSNFDMFFSLLINYLVIFNYIPYNIPSLCFLTVNYSHHLSIQYQSLFNKGKLNKCIIKASEESILKSDYNLVNIVNRKKLLKKQKTKK